MKSFGLILLLAATWVNKAFGKSNLYTGWTQKFDNEPYANLTAQVGDSITFIWTIDEIQNVFIHPTNNCTQTGRTAIGNISPTEYTFQPEDGAPGGKTIFFANDIGDRCENYGMRLIVTVFPNTDDGGDFIPIPAPAIAPVVPVVPTDSPVAPVAPVAPTLPPVAPVVPTFAPVEPTLPPVVPTMAPVVPTLAPVLPTAPPTTSPPTIKPTNLPTFSPWTADPTETPTDVASNTPTSTPTATPTGTPTAAGIERRVMLGLQMTLSGIDSLSDNSMKGWAAETAIFCTNFYVNDYQELAFRTSIAVTNVVESADTRRSMRRSERHLQAGTVVVTYNQVVSFTNTIDDDITDEYLAQGPFETSDLRNNYVGELQDSNDSILEAVTDSSAVTLAGEIAPTQAPVNIEPQPVVDPKEGFKLSTAAIIGIGCGAGAVLIIAVLFCIYCRSKKSKDLRRDSDPPPVNVSIKADEVSTLAGPSIPGGSPLYGDRSIGTVDYDYSKAYEDRDHSVSYAGGTLGSDTQDFSFPANAGATGAALGPYDDDGWNGKGKVKEEILNIFAPPGKLGVVIDTPDDGAPVVHAVKETSVVVDKVKVGDKLIAVDDEDVRTLTAIKVSKLISRKSANPSRKLTVLRITHV